MKLTIYQEDNALVLPSIPSETVRLIYTDPPFNTGKVQASHRGSYRDSFEDFENWIKPKLEEIKRILKDDGSLFVHLDYREVHYVKVLLDKIFGRENFQNEIIWSYDYGGRSKTKWPCKHNTILWYTKDPNRYVFNYTEIDRIPYMAPGLVGPAKAARGKVPTDVWWQTIVPTQGKERTGYPSQKPLVLLERIVKVHSSHGDLILDCFAGSGTTGEAALKNNREAILIDSNPEAVRIMQKRLGAYNPILVRTKSTGIA